MTHHLDDDGRRLVSNVEAESKLKKQIHDLEESVKKLNLTLERTQIALCESVLEIKSKNETIQQLEFETKTQQQQIKAQQQTIHDLEEENESLSIKLDKESQARELFVHMQNPTF